MKASGSFRWQTNPWTALDVVQYHCHCHFMCWSIFQCISVHCPWFALYSLSLSWIAIASLHCPNIDRAMSCKFALPCHEGEIESFGRCGHRVTHHWIQMLGKLLKLYKLYFLCLDTLCTFHRLRQNTNTHILYLIELLNCENSVYFPCCNTE